MKIRDRFGRFATRVTFLTGHYAAFVIALALIVVWLVTGPLFGFSNTWQLVINTTTTIVTFLMVFVIQHAANREMRAVQLKLDELIAVQKEASNSLIDIEEADEEALEELQDRYRGLAAEMHRRAQNVSERRKSRSRS